LRRRRHVATYAVFYDAAMPHAFSPFAAADADFAAITLFAAFALLSLIRFRRRRRRLILSFSSPPFRLHFFRC